MKFLNKGHQFFMYQQMSFMCKSIKYKLFIKFICIKNVQSAPSSKNQDQELSLLF